MLQFFILLFFISNSILEAGSLVINNVRYLYPGTDIFSSPMRIIIVDEKIQKLIPEPKESKNQSPRFVIPSFCDAGVTLGANSLGGLNGDIDIKLSLRSFLEHGFTHIFSIADGKWVKKWISGIRRNKILGPDIIQSQRPLLLRHKENDDISDELYFKGSSEKDFVEEIENQLKNNSPYIHLFYRYNPGEKFVFSPFFLRNLRLKIEAGQKTFLVSTYADEVAIMHSLSSGIRYIYHPIPYSLNGDIVENLKKEIHWSPMFTVYRNLKIQGDAKRIQKIREDLEKKSIFFRDHYSNLMKNSVELRVTSEEETKNAAKEFASYKKFFAANNSIVKNMYLSSGSGNLFAFPGLSGIQEFQFMLQNSEAKRSILWQIPSQNTCSFLGIESGKIQEGKVANLLVLKENPILNPDTLFSIQKVIKKGKIVIDNEKDRRKHGRK